VASVGIPGITLGVRSIAKELLGNTGMYEFKKREQNVLEDYEVPWYDSKTGWILVDPNKRLDNFLNSKKKGRV
jgi:hypothetical protein